MDDIENIPLRRISGNKRDEIATGETFTLRSFIIFAIQGTL
jgi:hypothetical protein